MSESISKTKLPKGEEHALKNITSSPSTKQMPQDLGKTEASQKEVQERSTDNS